jgi:hypothetical protein
VIRDTEGNFGLLPVPPMDGVGRARGKRKQLAGQRHAKLRLPCERVRRAKLGTSLNLGLPFQRVLLRRVCVNNGLGTPST